MDILIALTACAVPGLIFAVLFYRADRYEREPIHFLVLVFLWGTVPSLMLSELLNPQIISLLAWVSRSTVTTLVALALEEILKALAIASIFFFARQEFDGMLDGLVYGGMVGLGFATAENSGDISNKTKQNLVNVFIPTTPNPTSGYLLFVKASDTKDIDISVEEGLKIIVSGGMIGPEKLNINE